MHGLYPKENAQIKYKTEYQPNYMNKYAYAIHSFHSEQLKPRKESEKQHHGDINKCKKKSRGTEKQRIPYYIKYKHYYKKKTRFIPVHLTVSSPFSEQTSEAKPDKGIPKKPCHTEKPRAGYPSVKSENAQHRNRASGKQTGEDSRKKHDKNSRRNSLAVKKTRSYAHKFPFQSKSPHTKNMR